MDVQYFKLEAVQLRTLISNFLIFDYDVGKYDFYYKIITI